MTSAFNGRLHVREPVGHERRLRHGAAITLGDGSERRYDQVVIATHADEALRLWSDPFPEEQKGLRARQYRHNQVVLHVDPAVMPPRARRGRRGIFPVTPKRRRTIPFP